MERKYKFRFFFDYGAGGCLWLNNDAAWDDFDNPADAYTYDLNGNISYNPTHYLPLSAETFSLIEELDMLNYESLNKDYPPDPSLWRQDKCDEFNYKAEILFKKIISELGDDFEVINCQSKLMEDPDLDEYLKDPKSFER